MVRRKRLSEIEKEKETHASFAVVPQTAKVMATVHGKCSGNLRWKRHSICR